MAPTWASTKTGRRTLLRLATAGSVDDGKSTLVGRLLYDTNSVLTDTLDHVEKVSKRKGLASADLALLTDGLRAEREQGITCLLYTSPSPRDKRQSRMPSSA